MSHTNKHYAKKERYMTRERMNKICQLKEINLEDKSYDVRVQVIVTRYAEGSNWSTFVFDVDDGVKAIARP